MIATCRVGFSQAPQGYRFAPLVFSTATDRVRTREPRLRALQVACGERDLSQTALAFAFQLLVLDTLRERQTLFEELVGAGIIGLLQRYFAEILQLDGLPDPIADFTNVAEGFFVRNPAPWPNRRDARRWSIRPTGRPRSRAGSPGPGEWPGIP